MKRLALLVACLLVAPATADEGYLESISVSTTSAVATTELDPGAEYAVQCTVDASYRTCTTSSCTATTNDYLLPARPAGTSVLPRSGRKFIAFVLASGTGTCRLYDAKPRSIPIYGT